MPIMVPNNPPNTNSGEKKVYEKLNEFMPEDVVIYHNKEVKGQEFDFCLLIPNKGIVIIEVKGWKEAKNIEVINDNDIIYGADSGFEQRFTSPKKQGRKYRFNLLNKIKGEIEYNPLVIDMVCYPNISKDYYKSVRLDIISEEEWTIFKEDINDKVCLINKLSTALELGKNWGDNSLLHEDKVRDIRLLFESEEQIRLSTPKKLVNTKKYRNEHSRNSYSILQFIENITEINNILYEYKKGTKFYLIAKNKSVFIEIVNAHKQLLNEIGLVYDKGLFKINYYEEEYSNKDNNESIYLGFNFVVTYPDIEDVPYEINNLKITNGNRNGVDKNEDLLKWFHNNSGFNFNQYQVEHANEDSNIIVKAGAGTGKTFSMISRLTYLQFKNSYNPSEFVKSIVMLTFTNEASDEMKKRLKECFQNYYMLTKDLIYFKFIELIDTMNISTIHSLSKLILQKFSSYIGYGSNMGIVSGDYVRKEAISAELEDYLQKKIKADPNFTDKLNVPMYKLIEVLNQVLNKLQNKSINIDDDDLLFKNNEDEEPIHDLIIEVLRESEKKYQKIINEDNNIHLNDLIIKLNQLIEQKVDLSQISDIEYLFVDEFQDTDNIQIDLMNKFHKKLDFKFFVVGDVKQCIYRFRGAEEAAFSRLTSRSSHKFKEISLNKNYRTDSNLLNNFEKKFKLWSQGEVEKLKYNPSEDKLVSRIKINDIKNLDKYYKSIKVEDPYNKDNYGKALIDEILLRKKEIQKRIEEEGSLKEKERTIAILVRENWEAEQIRDIGKNANKYSDDVEHIFIETDTGDELYATDPALDLYKLVMALKYSINPKYLFNLTTSSYFNGLLNVKDIYGLDNASQTNVLINIIDYYISNRKSELGIVDESIPTTWDGWCEKLKYEPVLKVLKSFIDILRPWDKFALNYNNETEEKIKSRRFYKRNLELLFEKLARNNNQDYITINKLETDLSIRILTRQKDDIREASELENNDDIKVKCMTVHKSKGLEFDTVIIPFGYRKINELKRNAEVQLTISDKKVGYKIKICDKEDRHSNIEFANSYFNESQEKEDRMKEETRILYVALTRAIRSFTYLEYRNKKYNSSWQELLK